MAIVATRGLSSAAKLALIQERLRQDPLAPLYHFIAPEGDCMPFDPNGALYWQGRYHLFYIYQDLTLPAGGHCWGHASSADLLHWTFHAPALRPEPGDPDLGIYSGCAFVSKEGRPMLAYFGVNVGICLATAEDDDLLVWRKHPANPVIPVPQPGEPGDGVYNVFDPHVWLEGDTYYAILGGRVKPWERYDTAYLFDTNDLAHWRYLRPLYAPNTAWTGPEEDCACPDLFALGDRRVLLCISHARGARAYVGRWQEGTFIPERHQRLNWPGGSYFAPETLLDEQGRRVLFAWVVGQTRSTEPAPHELGVMALPRVLTLAADGSLGIAPITELAALRAETARLAACDLAEGASQALPLSGQALEIAVEALLTDDAVLALDVCCSPDGREATRIVVDCGAGTLSVDTSRSSLRTDICRRYPVIMAVKDAQDVAVQTAPLALAAGEQLQLRVFVDRSIVEVFANGRQAVTQRIYPTLADSTGVRLSCVHGAAQIASAQVWRLRSLWE